MADPMTENELGDLLDDLSDGTDLNDQLLLVEGEPYTVDDLTFCSECELAIVDETTLDYEHKGDPLCEECLTNIMEDAIHQNWLVSDYRTRCR